MYRGCATSGALRVVKSSTADRKEVIGKVISTGRFINLINNSFIIGKVMNAKRTGINVCPDFINMTKRDVTEVYFFLQYSKKKSH